MTDRLDIKYYKMEFPRKTDRGALLEIIYPFFVHPRSDAESLRLTCLDVCHWLRDEKSSVRGYATKYTAHSVSKSRRFLKYGIFAHQTVSGVPEYKLLFTLQLDSRPTVHDDNYGLGKAMLPFIEAQYDSWKSTVGAAEADRAVRKYLINRRFIPMTQYGDSPCYAVNEDRYQTFVEACNQIRAACQTTACQPDKRSNELNVRLMNITLSLTDVLSVIADQVNNLEKSLEIVSKSTHEGTFNDDEADGRTLILQDAVSCGHNLAAKIKAITDKLSEHTSRAEEMAKVQSMAVAETEVFNDLLGIC